MEAVIEAIQQREILKDFSRLLSTGHNLNELLGVFVSVIQDLLKVSRIAVLLPDGVPTQRADRGWSEKSTFRIKAFRGISPDMAGKVLCAKEGAVVSYLHREGTVLRLSSMGQHEDIKNEMGYIGINTAVPLFGRGGLSGILVFNNRITGAPVTDEELELVFALCNEVTVAIENIGLVEIISRQKNYLENILDNTSCGVITVEKNGRVVTYNPKAEEILGIRKDEILDSAAERLPADIAELLNEVFSTGRPCFRKELKLTELDKILGVSATPVKNASGEITGSVMIFTDLTPIKKLEEEARRMDRLDFTNIVAMRSSHELKNCLVSIKTFAQLLPERYMDKQFREDFYLVVNKEVDRLNQLVENLLFFAQELKLDCSSCNIEDLIGDVIDLLEKEDVLEAVEITKEYGHKGGTVDVDKDAMVRALRSVLYNSVQAMPKGGKIRLVTGNASNFLELKVIDEGVGIQPELINKVWDPFFTTKTRGIGLGLCIVRKILEAHGGNVGIISHLHKGTELSLFLPKVFQKEEGEVLYFPSGRKVVV